MCHAILTQRCAIPATKALFYEKALLEHKNACQNFTEKNKKNIVYVIAKKRLTKTHIFINT